MDELMFKISQILGRNIQYENMKKSFEDLAAVIEKQQKELTEAHNRELSYNDDIEQMDVMVDLLQKEVNQYKLQETLLLEKVKKQIEDIRHLRAKTTFKVYEENLLLVQEIVRLKGEANNVPAMPSM
ncbi:hypothetical protein [Bacillus sp. UNC438CL73TsuS30]|uniref:hypothetical protein n=1 Tax=Bacillus sp. UNC438CL73TsuS30 TaxID=1340434 RepID=UPI00047AB18A|nr:hypothetical protein [Bacillus sp. UNC438CL73TsuS30]